MAIANYNDTVFDVLFASNQLIMAYIRTSDANFLLKAIELQADGLRLLQNMLMQIEENKPCPN